VPVAADQLSLILTTLCYDGVLEPAAGDEEETWRIAGHKVPDDTAFTSFPCGICPVSLCRSPLSCTVAFKALTWNVDISGRLVWRADDIDVPAGDR
jgi:hypothetical protein